MYIEETMTGDVYVFLKNAKIIVWRSSFIDDRERVCFLKNTEIVV